MMPQTQDRWLHDLIQSIDHRLELVNTKLDMAIDRMVTNDYCQNECSTKKNAIDKRYFLGWGSAMVLAVAIIGVAIKFA